MPQPRRTVSLERQNIYLLGNALTVIGAVLFGLSFVIFIVNFGNFSNFEGTVKKEAFCAVGGMALMIIGGVVRTLGAAGVAGSGMVLDPEQARRDLEPLNRMRGGMIQDTLSEVEVVNTVAERVGQGGEGREEGKVKEVIKVRCRTCQALNDENAKFCNQCGSHL